MRRSEDDIRSGTTRHHRARAARRSRSARRGPRAGAPRRRRARPPRDRATRSSRRAARRARSRTRRRRRRRSRIGAPVRPTGWQAAARRRWDPRSERGSEEPSLLLGREADDGLEHGVLAEHVLRLFERDGHLDLLRASVAALRDDAGLEDAEHVELRDEVRDAALREDVHVDLLTELTVRVVHFARREALRARFLTEDRAEEHELALRGERAHDLRHAVELDLVLRLAHILLADRLLALALRKFGGDAEEVERASRVAVLLRRERGAKGDDAVLEHVVLERHRGALAEDVLQLVRIVRREDDLFFSQPRFHARVEELGEL